MWQDQSVKCHLHGNTQKEENDTALALSVYNIFLLKARSRTANDV